MAVNEKIRDKLPDGSIIFNDEAFDNSIIGISSDSCVVYSYSAMVEEYMKDNNCSDEDAIAWIDYNTIRALPYLPTPRPIIITRLEDLYDE